MMKYIILPIALFLIIYPIQAIIVCIKVLDTLSNYGIGVLTGGIFFQLMGVALLFYSIRLFKRNKKTTE